MQKGVVQFEDLKEGMKVTGKIKNVVDFGAFVDIGLHETGLIHVSELSDNFIKDPMEVVKVGDVHEFTILELDQVRRRISLSLKSDAAGRAGTGQKSAPKRTERPNPANNGTSGNARRVVVKKNPNRDSFKADSAENKKYTQNSDEGMNYNPFAAFFNQK